MSANEPGGMTSQVLPAALEQKHEFVSNVLKLAGGTTLAQALTVLAAPFLARLYAPSAFGIMAVFVSIASIVGLVACLRYDLAILLPKHDKEAANLLAISLGATIGIASLSACLILLTHAPIVRLLNAPDLEPYLWLVPLTVCVQGWFLALSAWNTRTKHFGRLSIAQLSQSVTMNGTQLALGVLGETGAGGLIGGSTLGYAMVTAVLGAQIGRDDGSLILRSVTMQRVREGILRYRKFPLLEMWGALLNGVAQQLSVLLLSVFFSSTIVGYFALGNRLLGIPSALLGNAVAQVFFQRASELRSYNGSLTGAVEGIFRQLVNVSLFPAMLLALIGRDLVVLVFGPQWAEAGVYLQILSVWAFFQFIFSPISTLFVVIERQDLALVVHGSLFFSRLFVLLLGGLGGDARMTISLYAITGACVYGALVIWNLRLSGSSVRYAVGVIGQNLIYCLPAMIVLALAKWWFKPSAIILIGAVFLVLGGYLVFLAYSDSTVRHLLTSLFDRAADVLTRSKSQ